MNAAETRWLLDEVTGPALRLASRPDSGLVDILLATAAEVRMIAPDDVAGDEREVFDAWDLPSRVETFGGVDESLSEEESFGALLVSGIPTSPAEAPRLLDRALARLGNGAPVWIDVAKSDVRVDRARGLLEGTCSDVGVRAHDHGWVLTGRRRAPGRDILASLQEIEGLAVVVPVIGGACQDLEETLASVLFHLNPMPEVVLVLDDAGRVSDDLFGMAPHASTPAALMRTSAVGRSRALAAGLDALEQQFVAIVHPGWRLAGAALRALAAGWRRGEGEQGCVAGEFGPEGEFSGALLCARADLVGALTRTSRASVPWAAFLESATLVSLPFPVLIGAGNEAILR